MASQAERNGRQILFVLGLIALFLVCFSIPLLLAGKVGGLFAGRDGNGEVSDAVFPEATVVSGPDSYLRIKGGEILDSPLDKDFLLAAWFKLRNMPRSGETTVFFQKIEEHFKPKVGYGLGLIRDKDVFRPVVYWRSAEGKGGARNFPEITVPLKNWFMFALSFYGGRYLGLHLVLPGEGGSGEVKLIGGYDLGENAHTRSAADLIVGAANESAFRGRIGAVGVFNARDLEQDLGGILNELAEKPREIPSRFSEANVIFWSVDGKLDSGKHSFGIEFHRKASPGG